jgi:hypothetical protein
MTKPCSKEVGWDAMLSIASSATQGSGCMSNECYSSNQIKGQTGTPREGVWHSYNVLHTPVGSVIIINLHT